MHLVVMDAQREVETHRRAMAAPIQATTDLDNQLTDLITQTKTGFEPETKCRARRRGGIVPMSNWLPATLTDQER